MNKLKTECKTKTSSGPVLDVNGDLKPDSCRLCLTTNDNMRNIFNRKLLENIKYCTGISIKKEDCLPTNICISCQTSLAVAHKFKKLCILTEQICQNVLENQIKAELTHKSSKTLDSESDDGYFNDGCVKKDLFNDSHNEICVKEDNSNDNFNGNCVKEDHPNDDFNEIKSNDDHFNEDQFNGDQFNDDNDNVIVSDLSVKDNGLIVVKKEELDCEYEVNTEEVPKELLDDLEVKSHIDRPRRQPKPRKLYDGTVGNVKKVGKKRGPYRKKSDPPLRRKKFKYFKLFCETCQIKFTCKKDSDQHKETVHKETWASMCEICGKLFTYRGSFTSHVRSHLPPEHACQHCDYRTSNKYDLAKHLLIHAGTKKYHCAKCPNSYYTVSNLREHERMVHERLLRHACDICGKMFYDRTHLRRHVDSHNDVKRYECTLCRTAYTRRCYWKKHMLRQHGVHAPTLRPGRGRGHAHFAPDAPDPFAPAHSKNSAEQSIL